MTLDQVIQDLHGKFKVIETIDFREDPKPNLTKTFLKLKSLYKKCYQLDERIIIVINGDVYTDSLAGAIMQSIQSMINEIDISNYFVELVTTNPKINDEYAWILENISIDSVPINITACHGEYYIIPEVENGVKFTKFIKYQSLNSTVENLKNLSDEHINLLSESSVFCLAPWTHLMVHPNSEVTPCCSSKLLLGDVSKDPMEKIWNSENLRQLRLDMLAGKTNSSCESCYIKEKLGQDSQRQGINRSLSSRIHKIDLTKPGGHVHPFELNYLDSRFNNLCNLACRSCGYNFSSSWHDIAIKFKLIDASQPAMLVAGKHPTDVFDQIMQHIDTLDRVYFAGGEPLINEQMWAILDELDRREKYNVELVYNTNFTKTQYRGRSIFPIWNKFSKVSVGASLDGEYARGEYLRSGTKWNNVIQNRQEMINESPMVDYYISSTVSIINALHLPDFHRHWVEAGLIKAEDYNIQLLFNPVYMNVDRAPKELKDQIRKKYQNHLNWLTPIDRLGRATYGFKSVLEYIDNDYLFNAEEFWFEVTQLDQYHNTDLLQIFPELYLLK